MVAQLIIYKLESVENIEKMGETSILLFSHNVFENLLFRCG